VAWDESNETDKDPASACGVNLNATVTQSYIYMPHFGDEISDATLELIQKNTLKKVIAIPANGVCKLGGSVRCLSWQQSGQLGEKINYIIDGGHSKIGLESTIIDFENEIPKVLRLGGLEIEQIEDLIGQVEVNKHSSSNPKAPGMLKSHYAPRKPVILGNIPSLLKESEHDFGRKGILSLQKEFSEIPSEHQYLLSPSGDLTEAASRLFRGLRELDTKDVDIIYAELMPENGLGRAMNDRLKRSAAVV